MNPRNLKAADLWTLSENSQSRVVTMENRMKSEAGNELVGILARDGQVSLEQRKWRWNAVTTYEFVDGKLSGSFIGGALRWQDKVATGYQTYLDEDGNQLPRLDRPFMGDSDLRGDIWLGYKRKLMGGKVDWTISLTMRNLIGSESDIPVFTNPDGQVAITRLAPEKSWFINSSFKF